MPFLLRHSVAPCQEVSSATQTLPSKGEAVFRLHALMNLRGESLLKIRASSVQPTANSRRPGAGRAQGPAPNGVSGGLRAPEPKQSGRPRGQRCGWGHRRAQRGQAALGATSFTPLTPALARQPRGHQQPAGHRAALLTASPCLHQEREAPWLRLASSRSLSSDSSPGAAQPRLRKAHAHCRPRTWGCRVSGGTPGTGTRQRESSRSPEGRQEHPPPREEPLRPSRDTRPQQATLDVLSHRPFPSLCRPGLSAGRGSLRVEPVWHPGPAVRARHSPGSPGE